MNTCMSWTRMLNRNRLRGDYPADEPPVQAYIAGDMRRIERDQRDDRHLARYAAGAGITPEQARAVLDMFLDRDCEGTK